MAKDIVVRVGAKIRKYRHERGWTQDYLAAHAGFGRPFISNVERGEKEPCLRTLETLADAFGITLAELFTDL